MFCRSLWRESNVLLFLLLSAIRPALSIEKCLLSWSKFQEALAERDRKRKPQIAILLS